MDIIIREATKEDSHFLAQLLAELGYPVSPGEVSDRLTQLTTSSSDRVIVALCQGQMAGLAATHILYTFYNGEKACRLTALVVKEAFRSQGVGTELVATVEQFARENSCDAVELTTAERRLAAHTFYLNRDYIRTGFKFYKKLD